MEVIVALLLPLLVLMCGALLAGALIQRTRRWGRRTVLQAHGPVKPIGYSPPIAANDTAAVSEPPPSRSHSRGSPPVAERKLL